MFETIFTNTTTGLTISSVSICFLTSIILGVICALVHVYTDKYSRSFAVTLALLPLLVQVVIMLVNGNLGTSVAILGAFSLIRFRSMPGSSRELLSIFLTMAIGLAVGTGYITFAILFTIVACLVILVLSKLKFGENSRNERILKITIPENLDYPNVFSSVLNKYTDRNQLEKIKTTNMGSLFELTYSIKLKNKIDEKSFIDELRILNDNLNIALHIIDSNITEL